MKPAIEWVNEMGETVANDMFQVGRGKAPGEGTRLLIERIQQDAHASGQKATKENWTQPVKETADSFPVVLYCRNEKDRRELIAAVRAQHPEFTALDL